MTADEAKAEARARWGSTGGAAVIRVPGKPNRYEVGCLSLIGRPYTLGEGKTFEAAFEDADRQGHTSEAVKKALGKAQKRRKWQALGAALGAFFGGG